MLRGRTKSTWVLKSYSWKHQHQRHQGVLQRDSLQEATWLLQVPATRVIWLQQVLSTLRMSFLQTPLPWAMWSRIMMITRIGDVTISMNNAGIKSMSMRLYRGRNQLAPRRIHSNLPSPSPSPLRCSRSHATMTIWSCFLLQQVMPYQIHVYD